MVMHEHEEEHEYETSAPTREWYTPWRRTSWGAVFAGAFVALGVFLMLQILGAGIGASTIDLTGREVTSARSLGIGAAIWWLVTGLIALFIGGWVAGRLGWLPTKIDRALHGLTVWAVFYVALFLLITTALSAVVGGSLALLGGSAQAAATSPTVRQTAEQAAASQGLSPQVIQQEIAKALGGGAPQNAQGNASAVTAVNDYLKSAKTPQDRQQAVQAITQATGMSEAQANQMLDNMDRMTQQAKETGEKAANVTGATFIGLAITMFLDAIAAVLGGLLAAAPPAVSAREYGRKERARAYAER